MRKNYLKWACVDPESLVRAGLTFLVDEVREDQNTTIIGPSAACQRKAGVPMMSQH